MLPDRTFKRDLDWSTYLTNLLKAIVNAVVWVLSFGQANTNSFFKPKQAKSIAVIKEVTRDLKQVMTAI